jgi:hypothetical protein
MSGGESHCFVLIQPKQMFNLIPGFTMSECSELITSSYNSVAWYKQLAEGSKTNREYWLERAEKAEAIADKLNEAYTKALYDA